MVRGRDVSLAAVAMAVVAVAGCRTISTCVVAAAPTTRPPALLSDQYDEVAEMRSPGADPLPAWPSAPPPLDGVSEVTLQRTSCLGSCPAYQVTFRNDGKAEYWGGSDAPRQGRFQANAAGRINHLAAWARALGILDLRPTYSVLVIDAQDSYVSIVKDGERRILFDPGSRGPVNLYAYECMIDSVAQDLQWEPATDGLP